MLNSANPTTKLVRKLVVGFLTAISCSLILYALWGFISHWLDSSAAKSEYQGLREMRSDLMWELMTTQRKTPPVATGPNPATSMESVTDITIPSIATEPVTEPPTEPNYAAITASLEALQQANPDFIAWLLVLNTGIDYPLVQGNDNDHYLHTTFNGFTNPAGTIFMDFRCRNDFSAPLSLIHGHNMRDGSMFAPLVAYLDPQFQQAHPDIVILTNQGERLDYQVLEVQYTNAWNRVFSTDYDDYDTVAALLYNPPPEGNHLIALATCLQGDDRIVIYAQLVP